MLNNPGKSILTDGLSGESDYVIDDDTYKTIMGKREELNQRIGANKELGTPTDDLEKEVEKIDEYLKKCFTNTKHMRRFPSDKSKEKENLRKRVGRALDELNYQYELKDFVKHFTDNMSPDFAYNPTTTPPWKR